MPTTRTGTTRTHTAARRTLTAAAITAAACAAGTHAATTATHDWRREGRDDRDLWVPQTVAYGLGAGTGAILAGGAALAWHGLTRTLPALTGARTGGAR